MDGFQQGFLPDVVNKPGFLNICLSNGYGRVPKLIKVLLSLFKAII